MYIRTQDGISNFKIIFLSNTSKFLIKQLFKNGIIVVIYLFLIPDKIQQKCGLGTVFQKVCFGNIIKIKKYLTCKY